MAIDSSLHCKKRRGSSGIARGSCGHVLVTPFSIFTTRNAGPRSTSGTGTEAWTAFLHALAATGQQAFDTRRGSQRTRLRQEELAIGYSGWCVCRNRNGVFDFLLSKDRRVGQKCIAIAVAVIIVAAF
jgi:hypothetical protein